MEQHAKRMGDFYSCDRKQIKCPQCNQKFTPAAEHSYYAGENKSKLVCSYNCMRKWDKEHPIKLKDYKKYKKEGGGK